jgi:hypothetical protein
MNLKRSLQVILLLIVLTPILSAQTLNENKKNSENELGIDLTRTYTGQEVQQIIDIILEEADASIDSAYKEGYKQATVELKPDVEYWKTLYELDHKNSFSDALKFTLIGFGSGLLLGGFSGIVVGIKIPIN